MTASTPADVKAPRTLLVAFWAVVAQVALSIIGALLTFGASDYVRTQMVKANNDAIAKHKDKLPYTNIPHDLHQSQITGLISAVLIGAIFVLLAVVFRRGKGWARWIVILAAILTRQPFFVLNVTGSAPALLRVATVLSGVASIVAIVALLLPDSTRYFAAMRPARPAALGGGAGRGGTGQQPAPFSLRTLFAPRPPAGRGPRATPQDASEHAKPDLRKPARPDANQPKAAAGSSPAQRAKAKARTNPADALPAPSRNGGVPRNRSKAKGR